MAHSSGSFRLIESPPWPPVTLPAAASPEPSSSWTSWTLLCGMVGYSQSHKETQPSQLQLHMTRRGCLQRQLVQLPPCCAAWQPVQLPTQLSSCHCALILELSSRLWHGGSQWDWMSELLLAMAKKFITGQAHSYIVYVLCNVFMKLNVIIYIYT